jgi:two-component system, chemotaxis family, protein-glutamate methylesterase/glutaminase
MTRPQIVVIGASLGGLHAVRTLLSALPEDFGPAIAVVQHRHRSSDDRLSGLLASVTPLQVIDVVDKQPVEPGKVFLAPPDYHLLIDEGRFSLSVDELVNYSRPSIDLLFESAADAYGSGTVAVVLTGANDDGARGARKIRLAGGTVIVQDPATAEAPAMPRAAVELAGADQILPLEQIGPFLAKKFSVTSNG